MGAPARHHISPSVRAAFLGALGILEGEGKTLKQMLADEIKTNGLLAVLDKVAKFQERTADVNMHHSGEVTSLVQVLTGIAEGAGHDTEMESEPSSVRH